MPNPWETFLPDPNASMEDRILRCEHTAVQYILQKAQLGPQTAAVMATGESTLLKFSALSICTGFPLSLVSVAFKTKQLQLFDKDLDARPEKTPLFKTFADLQKTASDDLYGRMGVVFIWRGRGKFHVFHNMTTGDLGRQGRWWRVDGELRFLEPLDAFVERLGPANEW